MHPKANGKGWDAMLVKLFNCPLDGGCISPARMMEKRDESGRLMSIGPRVCAHFRADGSRLYCAYAREQIEYEQEGPLSRETGAVRSPDLPGGHGFWRDSYISRRSRGGAGRSLHERRVAPPAIP
jgi:hypothetical protein